MARDNIFFTERRIFKLWGDGEITLSELEQLMRDRGWSEKEINFLLRIVLHVLQVMAASFLIQNFARGKNAEKNDLSDVRPPFVTFRCGDTDKILY